MKWRLRSQKSAATRRRIFGLGAAVDKGRVLGSWSQRLASLGLINDGGEKLHDNHDRALSLAGSPNLDFDLADQPGRDYRFLQSEVLRLLQELQVHRVELEMQNDELRRAVEEAEEIKERYVDLYEFAPVGYFTLDANTHIIRANLTGSLLLGEERFTLLGRPFTRWVRQSEKISFHSFLQRALQGNLEDSIEVTLISSNSKVRTVLVIFPRFCGHGVKQPIFPSHIPRGFDTPGRNAFGCGCKRSRCTRRCLPWLPSESGNAGG